MATHSSVLAWRIPGMGSHRVGHDWSDLAVSIVAFITWSIKLLVFKSDRFWYLGALSQKLPWALSIFFFGLPPSGIWNFSSPTMDWTHPCSAESSADFQGSPVLVFLNFFNQTGKQVKCLLPGTGEGKWKLLEYMPHVTNQTNLPGVTQRRQEAS